MTAPGGTGEANDGGGFEAMREIRARAEELGPAAVAVGDAIALTLNRDGWSYQTLPRLVKVTSLPRRTVQRALQVLLSGPDPVFHGQKLGPRGARYSRQLSAPNPRQIRAKSEPLSAPIGSPLSLSGSGSEPSEQREEREAGNRAKSAPTKPPTDLQSREADRRTETEPEHVGGRRESTGDLIEARERWRERLEEVSEEYESEPREAIAAITAELDRRHPGKGRERPTPEPREAPIPRAEPPEVAEWVEEPYAPEPTEDASEARAAWAGRNGFDRTMVLTHLRFREQRGWRCENVDCTHCEPVFAATLDEALAEGRRRRRDERERRAVS